MLDETKRLLKQLWNKKYIGAKHIPEKKLLKRFYFSNQKTLKQFEKEFRDLVLKGIIMKERKRTGKGMDWHLSLNPRKLSSVSEIFGDDFNG